MKRNMPKNKQSRLAVIRERLNKELDNNNGNIFEIANNVGVAHYTISRLVYDERCAPFDRTLKMIEKYFNRLDKEAIAAKCVETEEGKTLIESMKAGAKASFDAMNKVLNGTKSDTSEVEIGDYILTISMRKNKE